MDWDEPRPKPSAVVTVGDKLEALSVTELEERVAALAAEVDRVKSELAAKRARSTAADALFKM